MELQELMRVISSENKLTIGLFKHKFKLTFSGTGFRHFTSVSVL